MEILKSEILKLGGDENDYLLLKDVEDPDAEEWVNKTSTKPPTDTFDLQDFQKFYTALNFQSAKSADPPEPVKPPKKPAAEPKLPDKPPQKPDAEPAVYQAPPKPVAPAAVKPRPVEPEIPAEELKSAIEKLGKPGNVKLRKSPILKFGEEENTWFEGWVWKMTDS